MADVFAGRERLRKKTPFPGTGDLASGGADHLEVRTMRRWADAAAPFAPSAYRSPCRATGARLRERKTAAGPDLVEPVLVLCVVLLLAGQLAFHASHHALPENLVASSLWHLKGGTEAEPVYGLSRHLGVPVTPISAALVLHADPYRSQNNILSAVIDVVRAHMN